VSVCVCRKSVFCWNVWMDQAGFWHEGFLWLLLYCVLRKFGYLWNFVPNSGLRKFCHDGLVVATCYVLSSTKADIWREELDCRRSAKLTVPATVDGLFINSDRPPVFTAQCCHAGLWWRSHKVTFLNGNDICLTIKIYLDVRLGLALHTGQQSQQQ